MPAPLPQGEDKARVVAAYVKAGGNREEMARILGRAPSTVKYWVKRFELDLMDFEMVEGNVRLAKQKQKAQDTNRIERKVFREHARIENAVSAYAERLCELLEHHGLHRRRITPKRHQAALWASCN